MEFLPERLLRRFQGSLGAAGCVGGENGRPGEAEQVVLLEGLRDGCVHVAKLGAVALVEYEDDVAGVDFMPLIGSYKVGELLNGRDDDFRVRILQLLLQNRGGSVGVGRTFFKPVVFTHGLVVKVFAVNNEEDLVDALHFGSQLRGFERGKRLPRSGGVPNVAAGFGGAQRLVVSGDGGFQKNALSRNDLVGPHREQHAVRGQHTVPGEDVQQGVLGEERLGE